MICKNTQGLTSYAFRLLPGQDLKRELQAATTALPLQAAIVLSAVGSLKIASLRLAEAQQAEVRPGPFEIVSLVGTLCREGLHLHISLADATGATWGGHLLDGCLIHTTAEIVVLEQEGLRFTRTLDVGTGFKELAIAPRADR
jgi:predicted DNA-binding protein with PD1-like motif